MFIDYKSQVLLKYKTERHAKNLPLLLMQPTPANLRSECVHVCQERFDKKDQKILRTFFGPHDTQRAYINTIANFDVDKFRPLLNFITEKTIEPELKNIELLAWLIDFEPRPFDSSYIEPAHKPTADNNEKQPAHVTENRHTEVKIDELVVAKTDEAELQSEQRKPIKKRHIPIAGFILFFIAAIIYLVFKGNLQGGCMYWADDHYEAVACDKKIKGDLVVAADSDKLRYFKKITRPDTITVKALGHVWYSKMNNTVEYFTADGYHPIQIHYHLKPLTKYMIDTRIHPGMKLE